MKNKLLPLAVALSLSSAPVLADNEVEVSHSTGAEQFTRQDSESFLRFNTDRYSIFGTNTFLEEPFILETNSKGVGASYKIENFGEISLAALSSETDNGFEVDSSKRVFFGVNTDKFRINLGGDLETDKEGLFSQIRYEFGKFWLEGMYSEAMTKRYISSPEDAIRPLERTRFFGMIPSRGDKPLQEDVRLSVVGMSAGYRGTQNELELEYRIGQQLTHSDRKVDHTGFSLRHNLENDWLRLSTDVETNNVEDLQKIRFAQNFQFEGRKFDTGFHAYITGDAVDIADVVSFYSKMGGALRFRYGGDNFRIGPAFIFEEDQDIFEQVMQAGVSARFGKGHDVIFGLTEKTVGRDNFAESASGYFAGFDVPIGNSSRLYGNVGTEESTESVPGGAYGSLGLSTRW